MRTATAAERGWSLHGYQEEARDYLRARDRAGLLLDMGLGKTASSLSALEPRHLPVLVVAPKRVAETVWPLEAAIWRPDLSVVVAEGQPARRAEALADERADIVALGQDNLRDALKVPRDRPFQTLIIDELSGYKTRSSVRWKTARKLIAREEIQHVWGLTGTPSPNGLMNLWAQVALLDGGERLGKTLTAFRNRYFFPGRRLPSGIVTEWILHEGADQSIYSKLDDILLSMSTEGRIDLPPVTESHVTVELPQTAKRAYRAMKKDMVADLRDVLGGEVHTAKNAAVLTSKLSQISAGFLYVDDADLRGGAYKVQHNEKPKAVEEIVEGTGSPVLVFYRFKAERDLLVKQLGKKAHTIDEPGVIEAWNRGEIPVLLAHPASAGHGLNLQHGGHTIVWTTLDWDLELWQQANKRLARQGQKNPVIIHCIMTKSSIDHLVRASLDDKDIVQGNLLDHLESLI